MMVGQKRVKVGMVFLVEAVPRSREWLGRYLEGWMGLRMPRWAVCAGHQTPLDYLEYVFYEGNPPRIKGEPGSGGTSDVVVWACRGGGKTQIAAAATLLDLMFKPGVQIRILGGSLEQSEKMYGYLCELIGRGYGAYLSADPTQKRLSLKNGSQVQVLAQSESAVRGQRVQKLRCDEVELFDPAVWRAAQLTTRSLAATPVAPAVRGSIEAISTFHVVGGMMEDLMPVGGMGGGPGSGAVAQVVGPNGQSTGRRKICWCIWDVMERCPEERVCAGCALEADCGGKARRADGFVTVADVITMQSRVSRATWETEMLCLRPKAEGVVYPGFRMDTHVRRVSPWAESGGEGGMRWVCGIDPGLGTFACLWIQVFGGSQLRFHVARELIINGQTLQQNAARVAAESRKLTGMEGSSVGLGLDAVFGDIAVCQHNSHSGLSDSDVLKGAGLMVKYRPQKIEEGIRMIEQLLTPADAGAWTGGAGGAGEPFLTIDPGCGKLIAGFAHYRRHASTGAPIKDDVHDHVMDALRYAIVGMLGTGGKVVRRAY